MEESQVGVHEGQHLHIKNEQKTVIVQTDVKKKPQQILFNWLYCD